MSLNVEVVEGYLKKFPELDVVLRAGIVSMKMTRELLGLTRVEMQDMYKRLVLAGAVVGSSSSCFRASKELREYLDQRKG